MAKQYEKLKKEKEKQAEQKAKQALKLEAEGRGLHNPHTYRRGEDDRNVSPYFYGAFLIPVPMYYPVVPMGGCVAVDGHIHPPASGGCGGVCSGNCSGGCKSNSKYGVFWG
jgi:hypothetical protein